MKRWNPVSRIRKKGGRAAGSAIVAVALIGAFAPSVDAVSPELADRAAAAGINWPATPSWDVCVADVNNDGLDDFHLSLHMKNAGALYTQNSGGTFTKLRTNAVSPRPSPQGSLVDRHSCAFADVDHNGLTDLYSAAGRYASNRYKSEGINNELYLQTSLGVWRDVATQAGVGEPCTRGRHVVFSDFNGDGWADLFIGAQKERADRSDTCNTMAGYPYIEQSKVYVNRGADATGNWLGFRAAPEFNVTQPNTGDRGAISWDENGDGTQDLLTLGFPGDKPFFYRNNANSGFTELSRSGIRSFPAMNSAKVADVNGDGILDLVYSDNSGFAYRRGTATGLSNTSVRLGPNITSAGDGWSVAIGDINGDGRMDVYGQICSARSTGNPDDIVYVQQSNGTFIPYTAPSAAGDANDVEAVNVNGRAQFVVLNGGNDEKASPGPVQLITWIGS
jgi:FG-GAP-like repeat/FG-GAP repeat